MSAILFVPPSSEPLLLTEAKQFLRVEYDDDDTLIGSLIVAARNHVEAMTRSALISQGWRLVLDAWPGDGRVASTIAPLRTLLAARVFDAGGNAHELDIERFIVDAASNVIAAPFWTLPAPGCAVAGIELDVVCGYGLLQSDVPEALRQALRMLVVHWYDNRGIAASGGGATTQPAGFGALIAPYRMLSL